MTKSKIFIVKNTTCQTYIKDYDHKGLIEISNILDAKRYLNYDKADSLAFDLSDEDCSYKAVEIV